MECTEVAFEKIQAGGHNVLIFPAGHANLNLGDVLFFNIGDTIQEHNPTTFNQEVSAAHNQPVHFPRQKAADMFTKMVLIAHSSSQSSKDPQLLPCKSLVTSQSTFFPSLSMISDISNSSELLKAIMLPQ
ncbi:hypothetical protein DSO57_1029879 [Entomophthora muscae]|uniref:Uncharacterized protein n=1 Tax=Entomophthora muscae TaxID=34485 RepID=A0ACC2SQQ3_9FUNG|nr:hypothetical protein DSO57_1029879 [Entomophthora muscae]